MLCVVRVTGVATARLSRLHAHGLAEHPPEVRHFFFEKTAIFTSRPLLQTKNFPNQTWRSDSENFGASDGTWTRTSWTHAPQTCLSANSSTFAYMVAHRGVEPLSPPWEGGVLTTRQMRHMAAELGFEPRLNESESFVLPLHNSAFEYYNSILMLIFQVWIS